MTINGQVNYVDDVTAHVNVHQKVIDNFCLPKVETNINYVLFLYFFGR